MSIAYSVNAGHIVTSYTILLDLHSQSYSTIPDADFYSPAKGLPEKEYAFDLELYGEIIPEVSLLPPLSTLRSKKWD